MNPSSLKTSVQELSSELFTSVQHCRHHLHQYPELSGVEHATAEFIREQLRSYGIRSMQTMAGTGVVALIEGKDPSVKTVALRADIDALPIQELNDTTYASKHPGIMHACGHDVHTSCLLGAAQVLMRLRDSFHGSVKLVFQPSEEKLPGGAKMMIQEGVLNEPAVSGIIGQHVLTPLRVGNVGFVFGAAMASTDEVYITVRGKGGHAAYPDQNIDPVIVAARMLSAFQEIISRNISPFEPAVISFGKVIANGATNVIPDSVAMEGTIRTLNESVRTQLHIALRRVAEHSAAVSGASADVEIRVGYPVLNNHPELIKRCHSRAVEYLGKEHVQILEPRLGAEDFAYYTQHVPGAFYRLGTGNPDKGIVSTIHTPTFDIDESALEIGTGMMAWHALGELAE